MESTLFVLLITSAGINIYFLIKLIKMYYALKQCRAIADDARDYWQSLMWRTEATEIEKFEDYLEAVKEYYKDS